MPPLEDPSRVAWQPYITKLLIKLIEVLTHAGQLGTLCFSLLPHHIHAHSLPSFFSLLRPSTNFPAVSYVRKSNHSLRSRLVIQPIRLPAGIDYRQLSNSRLSGWRVTGRERDWRRERRGALVSHRTRDILRSPVMQPSVYHIPSSDCSVNFGILMRFSSDYPCRKRLTTGL